MMLLTIGTLLQLAATPHAPPLPRADSIRLRKDVDGAIHAFLDGWNAAWRETQSEHGPLALDGYIKESDERAMAAHCHFALSTWWVREHLIVTRANAQGACPRFLPSDLANVPDERRAIDNGIDSKFRTFHRGVRLRLRMLLDSAASLLPNDAFLAGQRVRFALDDGDILGAARAAGACTADVVQCKLLGALVLARHRSVVLADSAFAAAAAAMTPEARCEWNDVRVLLDDAPRKRYEKMSCDERAQFEARFWTLSDPLWIEPGNERRAEHFARKVQVGLVAATGDDGRQHFAAKKGGEAVAESLIRYGWPSQLYWGGPETDRAHDNWLRYYGALTAAPYVVREYSRWDRLHTVPSVAALDDPLAATRADWKLAAPNDNAWWPREHYAREWSAITELSPGQSVMLRRRDSTRFVWAGAPDTATAQMPIDSTGITAVYASRTGADLSTVGAFAVPSASRVVVDAPLAGGKMLLGIEVPGDSLHAAARTRFAVNIDAPLSALRGARAVSQALLFDPPDDATSSIEPERAIERMFTSTTFEHVKRVGIYWESYGFAPSDSVELTMQVTRVGQPNAIVRALRSVGIMESTDDAIGIRWREGSGNSRAIQRREGDTPVQLRSIVLDISRLKRGQYVIQLAVARVGETPVTSERRIDIR